MLPCGRVVTPSILDCTSCFALSMSTPVLNSIVTFDTESDEDDVTVLTPVTDPTASSTGTVTSDSTSPGPAPGKTVVTITSGIVTSGISFGPVPKSWYRQKQ